MQRGVPKSTQVVVTCTSADVRRMSCRWKVGRAPGPSDITTRFFVHLWRAIGTALRISELSPVVANRMLPRGGFGFGASARCASAALPVDTDAIAVTSAPMSTSAAKQITLPRQPPLPRTARSICAVSRASVASAGHGLRRLPVGNSELDPDVRASAVGVSGRRPAAVSLRDRPDDRQPQSGAVARAGRVRSAEPLEGVGQELGREALALVGDVEPHAAVGRPRPDPNGSGAVAQGVLDKIPKRL